MILQKENAGFEYQGRGVKKKSTIIISSLFGIFASRLADSFERNLKELKQKAELIHKVHSKHSDLDNLPLRNGRKGPSFTKRTTTICREQLEQKTFSTLAGYTIVQF